LKPKKIDPIAFLDDILARLFAGGLPAAFPDFGWQRKGSGWVATNYEFTKKTLGARNHRVVCNMPSGFLIYGDKSTSWLSYATGEPNPRGSVFFDGLRKLAHLAGEDASVLDREPSPEQIEQYRKTNRLRDAFSVFLDQAVERLRSPGSPHETIANSAMAYLTTKRGFDPNTITSLDFGVYTTTQDVRSGLLAAGFDQDEIEGSRLAYDSQWEGRIVYPWRNHLGQIETFWARDFSGSAEDGKKYLYLTDAKKGVAFGIDVASRDRKSVREIVIVEGVMDVLLLQSKGQSNIVGIGGNGNEITAQRLEALAKLGTKQATLLLDNDRKPDGKWPGKEGTIAAIENSLKAKRTPDIWVVDPAALDDCKDPDEYVRCHGVPALLALVDDPIPGHVYRGESLIGSVSKLSTELEQRQAIDRVLDFAAALRGERAEQDRERLIRALAEKTSYSFEAIERQAESRIERRANEDRERTLKTALRQAMTEVDSPSRDSSVIIANLVEELSSLRAITDDIPQPFSVDRLERQSREAPGGRSSGFARLDAMDVYFNPGELAVLAARTGHGKTSVLVNILMNMLERSAKDSDDLFLLYSAEEPEVRIFHRLIALVTCLGDDANGRWTVNEVRDRFLNRERQSYPDPFKFDEAHAMLKSWEANLLIVHRPAWSIADVENHARSVARDRPIAVVFADYIQRIPPPPNIGKGRRRDEEVSAVARRLKGLSEAVSAPVIAAAQINRKAVENAQPIDIGAGYRDEKTQKALKSRRPQLHHLREGGAEQEADLVLGLMNFRADFEEDMKEGQVSPVPQVTRLEVGTLKNRYGTPGQWVPLAFEGRFGLIRDPVSGESL
jgi:replicative DNA helicase